MCEFSGKLTAWMDHELAAEDATDVTRHLETCAECRARVEAYSRVTTTFEEYCDAYCDAVMESRPRRKVRRRVLKVWEGAALAAAAVAALFLLAARAHVQLSPNRPPAQVAGAPTTSQPPRITEAHQAMAPVSVSPEQTGQTSALPPGYDANAFPTGPALEIAFPADAVLPPGAVPDGVGFTADVTIAPDGSAQQIRLRPQLTEFERRSNQP
jgi:hypothetical protein